MAGTRGLLCRRRLLGAGAMMAGLTLLPASGWSRVDQRRLKFRHLHTDERLDVVYFEHGRYQPNALLEVDQLMRDWRQAKAMRIDHRLLDFLHDVQLRLGGFGEIEVLSGYRTPETNAMLRRRSRGVATRSLHLVGKAVDLNYTVAPLSRARANAIAVGNGGVGYYPRSNFIHLDTGPVRTWGG